MVCQKCQAELPGGADFCLKCGAKLAHAQQVTSSSATRRVMTELYGKGLPNPDASPGAWRLIPAAKLDLLKEFINPLEAALAYFVLSPVGDYAFALSHLVRSHGNVQWITNADYVCRIGDVLIEVGLLQS